MMNPLRNSFSQIFRRYHTAAPMMNPLRNSFSQILRRYHHHPASPRPRLIDLWSSSVRVFRPAARPSPPLHLQYYGTAASRRFVLRWYHDPRKVAAATAITLSATVMAACVRYDREIVPCTYSSHLVIYSPEEEREYVDSFFREQIAIYYEKKLVVDPSDPRSLRVRLIFERIVHAAHRGLGIYDSNDAPMLRVTEKRRPKWGKAQPRTDHLRGLRWELILLTNPAGGAAITPSGEIIVTTGLIDILKTDGEIAAVLAHELGHIIARHEADITNINRVPKNIFQRRQEIEADYIGILLLAAAGFHPQWNLVAMGKAAELTRGPFQLLGHPSPKKRLQHLSEPKTMQEALELYREVTALDKVTDWYFK